MELHKFFTVLVKGIEGMSDASLRNKFKSCSCQTVQNIDSASGGRSDLSFKPIPELWAI